MNGPGAADQGRLVALLSGLVPEIERRLAGSMQGLTGMVLKAHLPQRWVFATPRASASLVVGEDARVSVSPGAVHDADVVIEVPFERLEAALRTRDRSKVPPGPLSVSPKTEKGRRAFEFLRGRLGL